MSSVCSKGKNGKDIILTHEAAGQAAIKEAGMRGVRSLGPEQLSLAGSIGKGHTGS